MVINEFNRIKNCFLFIDLVKPNVYGYLKDKYDDFRMNMKRYVFLLGKIDE